MKVLLRVHLTPANLPVMPEFLAEVRETFLGDERFQVLLKPVEQLGGPNDGTMQILPYEARPQILAELETVVLGQRPVTDRLFSPPHVCYASRPTSLVIRADGAIGKCTVALSDPANVIGRLREDGLLDIDNVKLRPCSARVGIWGMGGSGMSVLGTSGAPTQPPTDSLCRRVRPADLSARLIHLRFLAFTAGEFLHKEPKPIRELNPQPELPAEGSRGSPRKVPD